MVMTMKKTTSLNISVAESEAKLDASACHPLVGGEATTTLMARWLILAIYFRNLRIALFHKLSAQQVVKQPSTIIDQSTPYSSPHGISRSTDVSLSQLPLLCLSYTIGCETLGASRQPGSPSVHHPWVNNLT
jgi:hypothetical protein